MAEKFKEKMSTVLSIPREIIVDVPRIIFDSNTKVYIENFKGISEYSNECISVNAGRYTIKLTGERMEMKSMTSDDVTIEGIVKMVEFV